MPNVITPTTTASPRDTSSTNETSESADDGIYPPDILTDDQILKGGFILYAFGLFYMFCALAIVCDEFFVPALEVQYSKHTVLFYRKDIISIRTADCVVSVLKTNFEFRF
jgi:hypothetical protein